MEPFNGLPSPVPKMDILSRYGCCAFQSLFPLLVTPNVSTSTEPRISVVDTTRWNRHDGLLLDLVRIRSCMAYPSKLANPNWICPHLSRDYHAPSCANHPFPLGHANLKSWASRIFRAASITLHHGCRLPRLVGFSSRRFTVPSYPSPISSRTSS
jgi:hypothetical protein